MSWDRWALMVAITLSMASVALLAVTLFSR